VFSLRYASFAKKLVYNREIVAKMGLGSSFKELSIGHRVAQPDGSTPTDEYKRSNWGRNKETIYERGRGAARGYSGHRSFDSYMDNNDTILIILLTVYFIILSRQWKYTFIRDALFFWIMTPCSVVGRYIRRNMQPPLSV
jgi:hypothetical protein